MCQNFLPHPSVGSRVLVRLADVDGLFCNIGMVPDRTGGSDK